MTSTPNPQANRLDAIRDSHTMKLVPLSQRELFWSELEPKIQALIAEARIYEVENILNIRTSTNGTTTVKKKAQDRLKQLKENK